MLAIDLRTTAIHLDAALRAVLVPEFAHDYARYIDAHCSQSDPGRLVTLHESTSSWPVWESHPAGDEIVLLLSGRAEFLQEIDGTVRRVVVGAGEAVVNPAGVPHTANVLSPFLALYITPSPGTTHRERASGEVTREG